MAKNYDMIMRQMTPELLAEKNVHLVTVDNRRLFYMTSSGQLFNNTDYDAAIQHEYQWLMYDPEDCDRTASESADRNCEPDSAE